MITNIKLTLITAVLATVATISVHGFQPANLQTFPSVGQPAQLLHRLETTLFSTASIAAESPLCQSKSKCPFALFHNKPLPRTSSSSNSQPTIAVQTKSSLTALRVLLFNAKRVILSTIAASRLLTLSLQAKHRRFPSKKHLANLDPATLEYVDTLFDIIRETDPFSFLELPKEDVTMEYKVCLVSRTIGERFLMKNLHNIVPPYHPDYNKDNRDYINIFLWFASRVTFEEFVQQPTCTIRSFRDQPKYLHGFTNIAKATLLNDYVARSKKSQRQLAIIHQNMGITQAGFSALTRTMEQVMMELIGTSRRHSHQAKSALVEFFMNRISTDVTRAGVIDAEFQ